MKTLFTLTFTQLEFTCQVQLILLALFILRDMGIFIQYSHLPSSLYTRKMAKVGGKSIRECDTCY